MAPGGIPGYDNLYRKTGPGYEACTTAKPPSAPAGSYAPVLQGASSEGPHAAIFAASDKLTPSADPGAERQLYECREGSLFLASLLPDELPSKLQNTAGTANDATSLSRSATAQGALSADASHLYWTASSGEAGTGSLYLRTNPSQPESARIHGAASGTANLIGPALGVGNTISGSPNISNVQLAKGHFAVGQTITGEGIKAATTVKEITEPSAGVFKIKMSQTASASVTGDKVTGAASTAVTGLAKATGAFEAGQAISGPGIPPETTIVSASEAEHKLTLSAPALETETAGALAATSPCTEPSKACTEPVSKGVNARFWAARPDGSKALFSEGEALYRYDATSGKATQVAGLLKGVLGASQDLSKAYFLSEEQIGGKGAAGKPNLYLDEEGTTSFIATLSSQDAASGAGQLSAVNPRPNLHLARVNPSGQSLAFSSNSATLAEAVAGYDNTDQGSGEPDSEIYLYEAGAKALRCLSCNRSGSRPTGREAGGIWAASLLPTAQTSLYLGRPLSSAGDRLFFESYEALVHKDANGKADVYQWEKPGTGSCTEAKPAFSSLNGGCIALISSGEGSKDSGFIDADPTGKNVFLSTSQGLVEADPGEADLYDARVNGGFSSAKPKFKLTVSKTGSGAGTVTSTPSGINCGSGAGCEAEYEEGTQVELGQSAEAGSEFKEWTGACTGSGTCKVTMSQPKRSGPPLTRSPAP